MMELASTEFDLIQYLPSSGEGVRAFLSTIWGQLVVSLVVFFIFLFIRKVFIRYVFRTILNLTRRIETDLDRKILDAMEVPLRSFIVFLGLYISLSILPLPDYYEFLLLRLFRASIIVVIAWAFYNLASTYLFDELSKKLGISLDQILIPFLTKVFRFIIIALAISVIAQEWGYDISGFIAGLGLGGLAVAFAAKDAIANIFGGVIIITEKPFTIGDWIMTPSVEGTVEDITFRSTKVRTFADSLVTAPNSTLANEPITNWTKMGRRRIVFHLGVTYTTPKEKLETCVRRINEMLTNHPEVHKRTVFARFDSYGESSLNIFIYFFTVTTVWGEYLRVKEDTNFKIMEILQEEGVQVAFPSRSVYFETPLPQGGEE